MIVYPYVVLVDIVVELTFRLCRQLCTNQTVDFCLVNLIRSIIDCLLQIESSDLWAPQFVLKFLRRTRSLPKKYTFRFEAYQIQGIYRECDELTTDASTNYCFIQQDKDHVVQ